MNWCVCVCTCNQRGIERLGMTKADKLSSRLGQGSHQGLSQARALSEGQVSKRSEPTTIKRQGAQDMHKHKGISHLLILCKKN